MSGKRYRNKRRKNSNSTWIFGGIVLVVAVVMVAVLLSSNSSASPSFSSSPAPAAPLDGCGSTTCGDAKAPVTIDLYADFQCPYCGQFDPVLQKLGPDYVSTGKVKIVYHNFAFIGAESDAAGQAALCAADQNHFWKYANNLFTHQGAENTGVFKAANLKALASALGLNTATFNSCLDSGKHAGEVQQQTAEGRERAVQSTPTFFVNNKINEGGVSYDQLVALVNAALPK